MIVHMFTVASHLPCAQRFHLVIHIRHVEECNNAREHALAFTL